LSCLRPAATLRGYAPDRLGVARTTRGSCLASTKIADKAIKKAPPLAGSFLICDGLVIADAVVIAAPPIRTPRNEGLSAQPPTIVVGVVIGTVNPDPNTVPKYPMTVM